MTEHLSGSSLSQHPLKQLLLPNNLLLLLYLLISIVVLMFLNINVLGQVLLGQAISIQEIVTFADKFSAFQDKLSTPIVMVFWLFIGAVVYTSIWLAENVFFIAKTEVAESHYVSRNPALQHRNWESTVASTIFLAFSVLLGVCLIALYLRVLLPAFSHLFHSALYAAPIDQRFLNMAAAIIGNTLAIYVILLMRRVITYSWRANRP